MTKILVTGARGQLAQCLKLYASQLPKNYQFVFLDKSQLDVADQELVETYFFSNKMDCVINCAAYTAVDNAETHVEKAFKVNADAVKYLAKETKDMGADFIHISTDYVFDGKNNRPYEEMDLTYPTSVYGKSKLEGERLAMEQNPNSIIIRTAWVYSQFGNNFFKTMLRLFNEREEIGVVADQIGSPTNANDLAKAICKIVQSKHKPAGIYHYTNRGETSWYDFALAIKEFSESEIKINPITTEQYPTPATRPQYSVLDTKKIQSTFKVDVPNWEKSLRKVFEML